jgi:hypothetical protein
VVAVVSMRLLERDLVMELNGPWLMADASGMWSWGSEDWTRFSPFVA